jgi:hypothetical protein
VRLEKKRGKPAILSASQHLATAGGTFGKENLVVLQEIEQSCRSNLVLCASLQRFSSFLAITIQHYQNIKQMFVEGSGS